MAACSDTNIKKHVQSYWSDFQEFKIMSDDKMIAKQEVSPFNKA
jgi:hypothetical protein